MFSRKSRPIQFAKRDPEPFQVREDTDNRSYSTVRSADAPALPRGNEALASLPKL